MCQPTSRICKTSVPYISGIALGLRTSAVGETILPLRVQELKEYLVPIDDLVRLLRLAIRDRYRVDYDSLPVYTFPASQPSGITNHTSSCCAPTDAKAISSPDDISPVEKKLIVWVGEESPTLTKLLMTSPGSNVRMI